MSQAQKIWDLLIRSDNHDADIAFILGWNRAEPPYKIALLETIMDRAHSASTVELIAQFHSLDTAWQKIMVARADSLYSGLRQAGVSAKLQTRLNSLSIIKQGNCYRLADIAAIMLRDHNYHLRRLAGEILVELAQHLANDQTKKLEQGLKSKSLQETTLQSEDHRIFLSALQTAVQNYEIHKRAEAVYAAMCLAPADDESFWTETLDPYHAVGKMVRHILINYKQPELAGFYVSALKHPSLRATSARVIAVRQESDFIGAIARAIRTNQDEQIQQGLKLIKHPQWLSATVLSPANMQPEDQKALVGLVLKLEAPARTKAEYLCYLAQEADKPAALRALAGLIRMDKDTIQAMLPHVVESRHESAALAGLMHLLKYKHPNLERIMIKQLKSPHPTVRSLAESYYRQTAFISYWNNFDSLSAHEQIAAGKAVYKIDPNAHNRWKARCRHPRPDCRLRAISMARLLNHGDQCLEELTHLAKDANRKVRSFAVAALGDLNPTATKATDNLMNALRDQDARVQANAIEALGKRLSQDNCDWLVQFTQHDNNRVRANAIKAMLSWKVESARESMKAMLRDPRVSHRRSACWAAKKLQDTGFQTQKENTPDYAVIAN